MARGRKAAAPGNGKTRTAAKKSAPSTRKTHARGEGGGAGAQISRDADQESGPDHERAGRETGGQGQYRQPVDGVDAAVACPRRDAAAGRGGKSEGNFDVLSGRRNSKGARSSRRLPATLQEETDAHRTRRTACQTRTRRPGFCRQRHRPGAHPCVLHRRPPDHHQRTHRHQRAVRHRLQRRAAGKNPHRRIEDRRARQESDHQGNRWCGQGFVWAHQARSAGATL